MKYPSLEYDEAVAKGMREIRGNVSSVKMTEAETQAEIRQAVGFAMEDDRQTPLQPKRRGRPPGSRNKPKVK